MKQGLDIARVKTDSVEANWKISLWKQVRVKGKQPVVFFLMI